MVALFNPDPFDAGSLDNMLSSLTGPLEGGAMASPLIPAGNRIVLARSARRPMILACLVQSLKGEALELHATLDPDGAASPLPPLLFEPYSEAGARLLLDAPPAGSGHEFMLDMTIGLELSLRHADGPQEAAEVGDYLRFEIVEGNLGKLLQLLTAEKARIRREAREIAAMKNLRFARRDALDRIGADLGVQRFQDELAYDKAGDEIVTTIRRDLAGEAVLEADPDYRRRLGLYRPFMLATPARFGRVLNGEGASGEPNAGPISELGLGERFLIEEENNPFALAIRIIGIGAGPERQNFLS